MQVYLCEERYLILFMKGIKGPHSKALKDLTHVLVGLSLFLDGQTLPQRGVAHVSKINIEAKTRKTTEAFTIKAHVIWPSSCGSTNECALRLIIINK
jgi:hypothetical protein